MFDVWRWDTDGRPPTPRGRSDQTAEDNLDDSNTILVISDPFLTPFRKKAIAPGNWIMLQKSGAKNRAKGGERPSGDQKARWRKQLLENGRVYWLPTGEKQFVPAVNRRQATGNRKPEREGWYEESQPARSSDRAGV